VAPRQAIALRANRDQLAAIVDDLVPGPTARPGIGPVTTVQAIGSFSHPGRCRSDAGFAKLAGTSPWKSPAAKPNGTGSPRRGAGP